MRYLIALLVAFAIIGLASLFVYRTVVHFKQANRAAMEESVRRGELTEADLNAGEFRDLGREMSADELWRIKLVDTFIKFWPILVSLTIGVCLGVAALIPQRR